MDILIIIIDILVCWCYTVCMTCLYTFSSSQKTSLINSRCVSADFGFCSNVRCVTLQTGILSSLVHSLKYFTLEVSSLYCVIKMQERNQLCSHWASVCRAHKFSTSFRVKARHDIKQEHSLHLLSLILWVKLWWIRIFWLSIFSFLHNLYRVINFYKLDKKWISCL